MALAALALDTIEDGVVDEPLVDHDDALIGQALPEFLSERLLAGVVGARDEVRPSR